MQLTQLPSPILVLGAAHAGKSEIAMRCLDSERAALVVGTANPVDTIVSERIATLKAQRSPLWQTLETSSDVSGALASRGPNVGQVLVDAINLWLASNLITGMSEASEAKVSTTLLEQVDELIANFASIPRAVLVSAELGAAPPSANPIERALRRVVGLANQKIAAQAASVLVVTAGIPTVLKTP